MDEIDDTIQELEAYIDKLGLEIDELKGHLRALQTIMDVTGNYLHTLENIKKEVNT